MSTPRYSPGTRTYDFTRQPERKPRQWCDYVEMYVRKRTERKLDESPCA